MYATFGFLFPHSRRWANSRNMGDWLTFQCDACTLTMLLCPYIFNFFCLDPRLMRAYISARNQLQRSAQVQLSGAALTSPSAITCASHGVLFWLSYLSLS